MSNSLKLCRPLRIAISGKSGCGNTTASCLIAERLNIKHINYTFRNLAKDWGVSFEEVRKQAELDDRVDRELDEKQTAMAMADSCVLGSRLAIWLLKEADLKVYLDVPLSERAQRVHKRESGDLSVKMQETNERDTLDRQRFLRLYGIDNNEFGFADLIINNARLNPSQVADLVIDAIPESYFCTKGL